MNKQNKLVLSQIHADMINKLIANIEFEKLASTFIAGNLPKEYSELYKIQLHDFMTAIYVGFEVEKSPHDKVREIYERYDFDIDNYSVAYSALHVTEVIKSVLKTLDIKIEGVNNLYNYTK